MIAAVNVIDRPGELREYVILDGCIRGSIHKIIRCGRRDSLVIE